MRRKLWWSIPLLVAASLLTAGIALTRGADDAEVTDSAVEVHGRLHHQHGGGTGSLPATSASMRLVGKMRVNQDVEGRVADIGVLGDYAYVAAFNARHCQTGGVYLFDISDPAARMQLTQGDRSGFAGPHPARTTGAAPRVSSRRTDAPAA